MERELYTIGKKIFDLRRRKGLSQGELGDEVGVSRQIISRWELDSAQPNLKKMKRLCSVFDVPLAYLLNEDLELEVIADSTEEPPITEIVVESTEESPIVEVVAENTEEPPVLEVVVESIDTQLDTEVAAEFSIEQLISEPVSDNTAPQTKQRKPWKSLVVAIVFTVLTFVPLFFSIITGVIAFSTNQGDAMVADRNFGFWDFFVSLIFTILCFIIAVAHWILYIIMKKARKNGS